MKDLLTQLALLLLRIVNKLPFATQITLGRYLGNVLYRLSARRRHIADVNLALCFPDKSDSERKALVKRVFQQNGIGFIETGMAWWSDPESFRSRTKLLGSEHLDAALQQGKGVILLGAHYSTLDLGGLLFSLYHPLNAVYRPHNNPILEEVLRKGRLRCIDELIDRSDFRTVIRKLKKNEIVWYAPDQDFGLQHSVLAPFFGVEAATLNATSRLAKLSAAPILLLSHHRTQNNNYMLRLHEPLASFPAANDRESAICINKALEKGISYDVSQYMWVHRRFKSNAEVADSYERYKS